MKPPDPAKWSATRARSVAKYQAKQKLKPKKPIRKVSIKQAKRLRVYEKNKAEFFEEVTQCQFPGCEVENRTIHHAKGRIGDNLTNKENFRAMCWVHHEWCELHPEQAKEMGLSLNRLDI